MTLFKVDLSENGTRLLKTLVLEANKGRISYALGWSDFHCFSIFENGHIAIDFLYLYELIFKKNSEFRLARRTRGKIFIFKKSQRPLK